MHIFQYPKEEGKDMESQELLHQDSRSLEQQASRMPSDCDTA